MFKKKYSDVNIDTNLTQCFSNGLNKTPRNITPQKYNLSPMKTRNNNINNYNNKSPRHFIQEENTKYSINKKATNISNNFQSQLSFLGTTLRTEYDQKGDIPLKSQNKNGKAIAQPVAFSNISNYQTSDRNMKESKRLFTNVISKMNEKNNKEGTSQKNSLFEEPKNAMKNEPTSYNKNETNEVSFKALKQIKMIESVQPLPPPPILQKSQSENVQKCSNSSSFASCKKINQWQKNAYLPTQFTETKAAQYKTEDKNKKYKIIELINNSFSSFLPIESNLQPKVGASNDLFSDRQIQVFESIEIEQSKDLFDVLLTKINIKDHAIQQKHEEWNQVKASFQSSKKSISMNPFL